jgi:hypothetical protein
MVAPRAFPNWVGSISFFNARLIHFFRIFLHPRDITFKLLRKSTSYFGYSSRQCFNASYSETRLKAKTEVKVRIETLQKRRAVSYRSETRVEWVPLPSPIQFFNFPQPMNYGNSKHATMKLSRDGFLIPCWGFAKLTKLMRPLNSTANFQGSLGQRRSGAVCSKGIY